MRKKSISLLLLAITLCLLSCQKQNMQPTVSLDWQINANILESGKYENSVNIINHGDKPLENNWVIYFNQFAATFELTENDPISIEHISGTYFKMYPTQSYKAIDGGDTLSIKWLTKREYAGKSFLPDGVYIVFTKDGKEEKPQSITSNFIRNDNDYLAKSANGEDLYYPFGNIIYAENAKYIDNTIKIQDTDIIPSVKSVEAKASQNKLTFGNDINIVSEAKYANEAKLLEQSLKERFGCNISNQGKTNIILGTFDSNAKPVNDEHYELEISEKEIKITAQTPHGIFNGTQTLLAILGDKALPTELTQCKISDYPDLQYRGIMVDIARDYTSKRNLLKLIDYLSMYKINILHLHMADDEGWRVEIPGLEELTEVGARRGHTLDESACLFPAYGSGWNPEDTTSLGNGHYTRLDFIEVLKHAKARHITIIPEIDLPGHARAAIKAMNARYNKYKDSDKAKAEEYLLIEAADTSRYLSVQNYNDNVINVALPSTYKFVNKVIDELGKMYVDAGLKMNILHIGGDEVPEGAWTGSPECKKLMQTENMQEARQLKDYFVEQVLKTCRPLGIQIAGWQEIALKPHANDVDKRFAEDNLISYCWNTSPARKADQIPYKLANSGFNVILCNAPNLYMDFAYSPNFYEPGLNWGGYVNEFNPFDLQPFNIYKSIRRASNGMPIDNNEDDKGKERINFKSRKYVMGIQGQLFSETIRNFDMVMYYLFPKSLGLVERGWNAEPSWIISQSAKDYEEAVRFFNAKIATRELPKLNKLSVNFRVAEPGLKIENGMLLANSRIQGVSIKYTTDGTEPDEKSTEWTSPISCDAKLVKAKAFYLNKSSQTVILHNKK